MVRENAYAKINLFLNVCSKRDDGFHNIETVMHTVSLCDKIEISAAVSDTTSIKLRTNAADLPCDENNLVYRAVRDYLACAGMNASVEIIIDKRIPVFAGLGGGSSDAAATLRGMNRIFNALSLDQLYDIASRLGSDIPFCLCGGTALCEGRGEIITPLSMPKKMYFVIAVGDDKISTPDAYAALDVRYSNFNSRAQSDEKLSSDEILKAILNGEQVYNSIYNIFESIVEEFSKNVLKIKAEMKKVGAAATLMSGSGPSVFGIFENEFDANSACLYLRKLGYNAYSATSV